MPATPAAASHPVEHRPGRGVSPVLATALALSALSALSIAVVLVASAGGHVLWAGFTIFPAVFFPVAFLLLCVEIVRGARRRSAR